MLRWLLAILAVITGHATVTAPAERRPVVVPAPPAPMPADEYAALLAISSTDGRCTRTTIGSTVATAAHCLNRLDGWQVDGDRAWQGPAPDWVAPAAIPRGATLYAAGFPAATGRTSVGYTLAVLGTRTVTIGFTDQLVMMAVGEGIGCTPGTSGMMAWTTVDGQRRPVGTMSVYSIDPRVTGLPDGQFVCGFAVG